MNRTTANTIAGLVGGATACGDPVFELELEHNSPLGVGYEQVVIALLVFLAAQVESVSVHALVPVGDRDDVVRIDVGDRYDFLAGYSASCGHTLRGLQNERIGLGACPARDLGLGCRIGWLRAGELVQSRLVPAPPQGDECKKQQEQQEEAA